MTLTVSDNGIGNTLLIDAGDADQLVGSVNFTGDNGVVSIGKVRSISGSLNFTIGSDARLSIAPACGLSNLVVFLAANASLSIGSHSSFIGMCEVYAHEPSRVDIGESCLVAGGVMLTTSDMHSIVDVETSERINPAASVRVEDKVWLGARSTLLKGVQVGSGSIVGFAAVVTKKVPRRCAVAGNPATIVATNVTWTGELLPMGVHG